MTTNEMDHRQFADWAAGYLLQHLIKGDLLVGVFGVLQNHAHWLKHKEQEERRKSENLDPGPRTGRRKGLSTLKEMKHMRNKVKRK